MLVVNTLVQHAGQSPAGDTQQDVQHSQLGLAGTQAKADESTIFAQTTSLCGTKTDNYGGICLSQRPV
jgi:hypothetical protein